MFRTSIRITSASLAIASLLLVMPAHAQSTASIRGVVRDVAGEPLPGATVTVKYTATAETESTFSGVDGTFAIAGLLAGKVEVEVSLSGFATQTSTVSLEAGQEASLDFTLTLARFAEEVTVTALKRGEQRLVDIPLAVTAVGGDELEEIGAQSIADVIQTAPGATAYESGPGANVPQIRGISATSGDSPIGYYLNRCLCARGHVCTQTSACSTSAGGDPAQPQAPSMVTVHSAAWSLHHPRSGSAGDRRQG
jgi:outer membrane receptor protein involved in Fe transport